VPRKRSFVGDCKTERTTDSSRMPEGMRERGLCHPLWFIASSPAASSVEAGRCRIMLNRTNGKQQLELVNMWIRALADEMALQRTQTQGGSTTTRVPVEMEEALYQLRLRKLLISAMVGPGRGDKGATRH
jgi:hypothetical protein